MSIRLSADEVVARLAQPNEQSLVAIDGLPCAGKSTLVEKIRGYDALYLDDFVRPESEWPATPGFPFEYVYYDEFMRAVRLLSTGACSYLPFDRNQLRVASEPRSLRVEA